MTDGPQRPRRPEDWWSTSIIDMQPGMIRYRGYAIEDLIGRISFAEMVYLMTRGELPHPEAAKLLEAALVAAVDHGPQAPSIAAARMAITCGVGINNAMASAVNMLGDVHGGAGEQCVALYNAIAERLTAPARASSGWPTPSAAEIERAGRARDPAMFRASGIAFIPSIRGRPGCSSSSTPRPRAAPSAGASPPSAARSRRSLRRQRAGRSR